MNPTRIYFLIMTILIGVICIRSYFAFHNPAQRILQDQVGKNVVFSGTIDSEPQIRDFSQIFTLQTDKNYLIRVTADRYGDYHYGDSVQVAGDLSVPRNFSSDDRTFDFVDYLGKDGIYYQIKKGSVVLVHAGSFDRITKILFTLKEHFLANIAKVLGEPENALAAGILTGEKIGMGNDLVDDFRKVGLIHIVILSGYSISIIAATIRKSLSFLPKTLALISAILGIILFGIMIGAGATAIRACLMAIISLSAELMRKDYSASRALFIAAALMIIQNPLILFFDESFQLSFLATLGLILLSSPIQKRLGFITERFEMRSIVASTLATQIFTAPYILYLMGQLSIVGVPVNIIVLPFIPITMLAIFFCGTLGFTSFFASQITGWAAYLLLSYELFIVHFASSLPFAEISFPPFSFSIVCGVYLIYAGIYFYFASSKFFSIFSQLRFAKKSST